MKISRTRIVAVTVALAALMGNRFAFQTARAAVWIANDPLTIPRYDHTATLLPNGKVLAAGGGYNAGFFSTADLYDPVSQIWVGTGSMAGNRSLHTATLLPNGKVLVAGGLSSQGIANHSSNGAELYDPTTGAWKVTGALATARYTASATLLPNGKVLVTGGTKDGGLLSTAELYDPASETWAPAGAMTTPRNQHTATLLPNGKVLITGGISLSSTEVYDPTAGTWASGGPMTSARRLHAAVLLPNGKVLVSGGISDRGSVPVSSSETYDPTSGTWTPVGAMSVGRYGHTATLLPNGSVLAAGGGLGTSDFTASAELYQPSTGTWIPTAVMINPRVGHTATLMADGRAMVAGGRNRSGNVVQAIANTEIYVKASGIVTLSNLLQTYDGTTRSSIVTTAPPDLLVEVTYNGLTGAPINAGSYTVVATINDLDYEGAATNTLVISKASGSLTLDNLVQTYDGTAKKVSFSTTPPGLTVTLTYNGSFLAPTNPGTYTVVGTINDKNYFGARTNTLLIGVPPVIREQPASRTNNPGATATFNVVADGTPPLSYQWRRNGVQYGDFKGPTLSLTNVQKSDEGLYSVEITNPFGSVVSADARLTVNLPPVADATATIPLVISVNGSNATVVVDGSRSHDPDGDSLQYAWFSSGTLLTNGAIATVTLPVGTNSVTLTVSDGLATDSQTLTVDVLTPAQAISRLIDAAGDATAKQSLLATLRAAIASIDRSNPTAAINQLQAFQNQVHAQLEAIDPETAQALISETQSIIDAVTGVIATRGKLGISLKPNCKSHLNFSGVPGQTYIIEASSDLVNWERIGEASAVQTGGVFIFDDDNGPNAPARYYRVSVP